MITDRLPHPLEPLDKPEPGASYTDPAFGSNVTRITASEPIDGADAVIKPAYSTVPAWNADESKLMLWERGRGHALYEGDAPYRRIGTLPLESPSDEASVWWDASDPDIIYYPSSYRQNGYASGCRVMRYSVSREQNDVWWDASGRPLYLPTDGHTISAGSDPQWMSREDGSVGLRVGNKQMVYALAQRELYMVQDFLNFGVYKNAFAPSASGKYYQFDRWVYDSVTLALVATLNMSNPYEHACPGLRTAGDEGRTVDVWNQVDFDHAHYQGTLVTHRQDGSRLPEVIIGPSTGYPYPPSGTHLSSIGPEDLVAVGIVGTGEGQTLLDNEILLVDLKTGVVGRLAHCRTQAGHGRWDYWSETHVNISPRGTRILFGSDWMNSATVDTYVIDLRQSPSGLGDPQ